jgi:hypothetical protein
MADEGRLVAGRYRLISELGAGGFGRVWKARDQNLRIDVAMKAIDLPQAGSGTERAERVARAMREARNAAQLRDHPNIVTVHDVVDDGGVPWIVMELVTGHTLMEEIDALGRLPAGQVREVARALLEALQAAHATGIVHRDVKPSNVLLAGDGRILLADFGTAVHGDDTKMTRTGMVIGSPEYLAPERIERGDDGPAGDLFSLGVTLYQAAEGVSPFRRPTPRDCLAAVLAHQPPPPQHAGELASLITALLGKDPQRRPTASAALAALKDRRAHPPTGPAHPPRRVLASYISGVAVAAGCFIAANFLPLGSGYWTSMSSGLQTAKVTLYFSLGHPFMRQAATGPDSAKVDADSWLAPALGVGTAVILALAMITPLLLRPDRPDLRDIAKGVCRASQVWFGFFAITLVSAVVSDVVKTPDIPGAYVRDVVQSGGWALFAASVIVMKTLRTHFRQTWMSPAGERLRPWSKTRR